MISKTTRFLTHVFMGLSTCVALTGCLAESGSADDPQSEGDDTALSATAAKTTCEEFGQIPVVDNAFIVQNDRWGAPTKQCVSAAGTTASFTVSTSLHNLTAGGAPAGYPSIFKGCAYGTCTKDAASVMKQVSNITSMKSTWIVSLPNSGIYDVAYDVWYNHEKPTVKTGQNDGTEIMVWINKRGGITPLGTKIAEASIAGAKWDVYYGPMKGSGTTWDVVSYLRQGGVTSVAFDLVDFANDAKKRGHLKSTDYLTSVQAGFEVWKGAAGLATKSFNVIVK